MPNRKLQLKQNVNIISQLLIAFTGFLLITSGQQRNKYYISYSQYFSNQQQSQKIAQILLIISSVCMISLCICQNLIIKSLAILSFLYYNILCYNPIHRCDSLTDLRTFIQNIYLICVAVQSFIEQKKQDEQFEKVKKQIYLNHSPSLQQIWYPLQLPVQPNDIESPADQVERMQQVVYLNHKQTEILEQEIQQDIQKSIKKTANKGLIKNIEKTFKTIEKDIKNSQVNKSNENNTKQKVKKVKSNKKIN